MVETEVLALKKNLTRRQFQCVELAIKGMSSKEIARKLEISPSTVDNHISAAMHIYRLMNRAALARYFSDKIFDFQAEDTEPLVIEKDKDTGTDTQPAAENTCQCLYCRGTRLVKHTLPISAAIAVQAAILFAIMALAIHIAVLRMGGWRPQ